MVVPSDEKAGEKRPESANPQPIGSSQTGCWVVVYTREANKDARKVADAGLKEKVMLLLELLARNPFEAPPPYEKLVGDLAGAYSRRINIQHRLVYQVLEAERTVKVLRMWTHYE